MTHGDLEQALRRCLAEQGRHIPESGDLATVAIRRAVRTRRNRACGALLAVVVITVVAGSGVVRTHRPGPEREPTGFAVADAEPTRESVETERHEWTPPASRSSAPGGADIRTDRMAAAKLPVDLVVGRRLITGAGETVDLSGIGNVARAHRTAGGWLALTLDPKGLFSLWSVTAREEPRRLLNHATAVVISPDADLVAWRSGAQLRVGTVDDGRLKPGGQLPTTDHATPFGFIADGVLLTRVVDDQPEYGVWWPRSGTPPTYRQAMAVYGGLADGRTLVGQLAGLDPAQTCLVLFDATNGLTIANRRCDLPLGPAEPGGVSPDGRWLLTSSTDGQALLVDLQTAFSGRPTVYDVGSAGEGPIIWVDERTALRTVDGRRILRVDTNLVAGQRARAEYSVLSPTMPDGTVQLVSPLLPRALGSLTKNHPAE